MPEPGAAIGAFLVGVAAGALGATVGGGSLLSIPFLIFLGLPAPVAIATDRFAGLGAGSTALLRFWRAGLALYLGVQILGGFFGAGTGAILYAILVGCFGITITQAAATQALPFLVLTLSSLALFAAGGIVDYGMGLALLAGTAVGGALGAHLAVVSGDVWVRRAFALVVLASAARLLV